MYLIVCYDIASNPRRRRVMRRLQADLTRVQRSVFEGEIPDDRYDRLRRDLLEAIDPAFDMVRLVPLCRRCVPVIELLGLGEFLDTEDHDEIV